jgi:hypothetical protein
MVEAKKFPGGFFCGHIVSSVENQPIYTYTPTHSRDRFYRFSPGFHDDDRGTFAVVGLSLFLLDGAKMLEPECGRLEKWLVR